MKIEIEHVSKKIKDALVPVSYTHLDVYKRQWLRRTALSCEFTTPSLMLLVDGSGPALARAGSR